MEIDDPYIKIIEHLDHFRLQPHLHAGARTEPVVFAYLCGFQSACRACGCEMDDTVYWAVCAERSSEHNSFGPQKHMRDEGWEEKLGAAFDIREEKSDRAGGRCHSEL